MASNVRQLPVKGAVPSVLDDDDDDECPKCPAVGAPAWLATFADIATNLMAFFVLILGFAKFDEPSFEKMAGSMRETFGSSMIAPIMKEAEPGTVIDLNFAPGSSDGAAEGQPPKGSDAPETEAPPENRSSTDPDAKAQEQARAQGQAAAEALMQALESGAVKVQQGDKSVTLRLPEGEGQPDAKALAEALAKLAGSKVEKVAEPDRTDTAQATAPAKQEADPADASQPANGETELAEGQVGQGGEGGSEAGPGRSPGFAKAKLSVALKEEVANGLVTVERREGTIVVTVGEGGGFTSGSADLTDEARDLLGRIVTSSLSKEVKITVTGHTDNVPLGGGSPFVDNLGLGSARAAAVVRELVASGQVDPARIDAVSKGEMMPIADNATAEGRAKNRRIEIEIDYPAPQAGRGRGE